MPRTTARTSKSWYRLATAMDHPLRDSLVPSWDRADSEQLAEQEPKAAAQWAKLAGELSARLTVISSDVMFSGPRMFHEETSRLTIHRHGPLKCAPWSERSITRRTGDTDARVWMEPGNPTTPALRTGLRVLSSPAGRSKQTGVGTPHRFWPPIWPSCWVRAYEKRIDGLHHLSGAERTSPFRFVSQLATACGLPAPAKPTRPGLSSADDETFAQQQASPTCA